MDKIVILCLFVLTYVLIIALPNHKTWTTGGVALVSALFLIIVGVTDGLAPLKSIKYDVVFMLAGIMLTVGVFADSNMPNLIADKIMSKMPGAVTALVVVSLLSGLISAFVDNVATVLMLAPIGLAITKKLGVSPIPVLISIAVSSNLQGAATLIGDTTAIMLADAVGMGFFDFFVFNGRLSMFWSVELSALATIPVLIFVFRKHKGKLNYASENVKVKSIIPTIILLVNLGILVCTSFLPESFDVKLFGKSILNGVICLTCGIVAVVVYSLTQKQKILESVNKSFDYHTILFLVFLFIIIGGVEKVGIIQDLANIFASLGDKNVFLLYTVIVFASVIFSAFIDNIPYVATMLPVITGLSGNFITPEVTTALYFGLLIGATLGGNITPFGASANVVAIGVLKKEGYSVKNADFFKIGIPFTLVAVLVGYVYTWLVWCL
ncbi:MAG: TRAP transporter large permease subunit [Clostridia bacterium]|nr:TRAP transporter large permease subunit [Clostridia bacterium]